MQPSSRVPVIVYCYLTFVSRFALSLVGKLHGSVELPCVYPLSLPLEEISVYWQLEHPKTNPVMVAAIMNGVVNKLYVEKKFKDRTHLNPDGFKAGNFTLSLTNLSSHDNGTYVCYVMWNPSSTQKLSENKVELEVRASVSAAEFSTPVMDTLSSGKLKYGEEVTLTCTSQGGLEEPRIMWINASNGSKVQIGHVHQDVHQDKDIINVTSTITLNITSNMNISCVILTKNGNLTSENYEMNVAEKAETSNVQVLIVSFVIGALLLAFLIVILVKLRHMHRTPSYEVPMTQIPELERG